MDETVSSGGDNSMFIQLTPPDSSVAGQYANVDGAKFGAEAETTAKTAKSSGADSIVAFDSLATDTIESVELGRQIGTGFIGAKAALQHQLDTLTPDDPKIPLLEKYIEICNQMLDDQTVPDGAKVNIGLNKQTGAVDFIEVTGVAGAEGSVAVEATAAGKLQGPSKWFAGNSFTLYQTVFLQLVLLMMKMKDMQSRIELTAMSLGFDLAKESSKDILEAGKKRAEMHKNAAIAQCVAGAVAVAGMAVSIGGALKTQVPRDQLGEPGASMNNLNKPIFEKGPDGKPLTRSEDLHYPDGSPKYLRNDRGEIMMEKDKITPQIAKSEQPVIKGYEQYDGVPAKKPNGDPMVDDNGKPLMQPKIKSKEEITQENTKWQGYVGAGQALVGVATNASKAWEEFQAAKLTLAEAEYNAAKAMVDYYLQNQEKVMQKAIEAFKTDSDYIASILSSLDAWSRSREAAIEAALKGRSS